MHTISVTVVNSGGFSAQATLLVSTDNVALAMNATIAKLTTQLSNATQVASSESQSIQSLEAQLSNRVLTVMTVAPGGTALSGTVVTLSNSSYAAKGTTDSTGTTLFLGLSAGSYTVSATINGTLLSTPVLLSENATVVLEPPVLSTTAQFVTSSNGAMLGINVSGNVTSSQMSNLQFINTNGQYELSFTLSGISGTSGTMTLSIPKSAVPSGRTPSVKIDGVTATAQSYTQDSSNYYVTFSTHFSTHSVTIVFSSPPTNYLPNPTNYLTYIAILVVAVLVVAGGLLFVKRRAPKSKAEVVPPPATPASSS
jgi:hypothetical protein